MTKISEIVPVAVVVDDADLFEMELADGTSVQITGLYLKQAVMAATHDQLILRSQGPGGHRWKFTVDDTGNLSQPGEDLGV